MGRSSAASELYKRQVVGRDTKVLERLGGRQDCLAAREVDLGEIHIEIGDRLVGERSLEGASQTLLAVDEFGDRETFQIEYQPFEFQEIPMISKPPAKQENSPKQFAK